jgi:hypothetical protein
MPAIIKRSDLGRLVYLLALVVANSPDPADVADAKRLMEIFEAQLLGL